MPVPEFIVALREHVGHAQLWLPGVTAVVCRGDEVLLVRRSDNGRWAPITGIVDPGEEPAIAAAREAWEETGVVISVDRLALVGVTDPIRYDNGDEAIYLDLTFACTYLSGEAHVADDESTEVGWFPVTALPDLGSDLRARVDAALGADPAARFLR